ncbi:succinate dehydrogenase assembly factor 2 [Accumulibacter sp.]|jgi:antitoxin CptB|uniref:FAD assembly factor SdhE n=1 Tax=Accumulibacter sp. TaxID=2053492 RepID=UPI001ACAB321|nr:succinate dehydrogenase assembly factor 2 [Accumulibacter sp.]MBN8454783.1 succinate dehydrogenase assembly factor 2 [Accumulibacter sp.]MBO3706631.1 succinate dehydrogenase assembly factor 2 [Candidatus Accumulibacter conexus]
MDDREKLNRLRWRCTRRAMLEMDLLLGEFLERVYPTLSPAQADAFVTMADMEDLELWPLVNGNREPDDPVQAEVLALLRNVRVK